MGKKMANLLVMFNYSNKWPMASRELTQKGDSPGRIISGSALLYNLLDNPLSGDNFIKALVSDIVHVTLPYSSLPLFRALTKLTSKISRNNQCLNTAEKIIFPY